MPAGTKTGASAGSPPAQLLRRLTVSGKTAVIKLDARKITRESVEIVKFKLNLKYISVLYCRGEAGPPPPNWPAGATLAAPSLSPGPDSEDKT